jgi:MFS family permease
MGGLAIFSTTMSKNPALPLFISSLGVDEGTLGLIAAASTMVGVVVSLPAGILSDLWGRRNVILLSMVVFATAPFLYLLVTTPGQLVLVRVYHGLATAILGPVAMAAVADTFRAGRGERMAWYSSATMVGRFLAPSVGGLLIVGNDFHWVYLGCGVAGVLALVASLRWQSSLQPVAALNAAPKRTLGASWATMRGELGVVLRNRDILLTSLMEAAQYFAFGAVETFLPLYLIGIGYSAWEIGPLFTAQILVTAVTKPALGRLSDRLGRKQFPDRDLRPGHSRGNRLHFGPGVGPEPRVRLWLGPGRPLQHHGCGALVRPGSGRLPDSILALRTCLCPGRRGAGGGRGPVLRPGQRPLQHIGQGDWITFGGRPWMRLCVCARWRSRPKTARSSWPGLRRCGPCASAWAA